jgi:SWIM zinc finger.
VRGFAPFLLAPQGDGHPQVRCPIGARHLLPPLGGYAGKEEVMVKLNPLRVPSIPWITHVVPYIPYDRPTVLAFEKRNGEVFRVLPQLFGEFLVLGVDKELHPADARAVLEFLRGDITKFYTLRQFLLRDIPEGSSEKTVQGRIIKFSPDKVKVYNEESMSTYTVRIFSDGSAECSCPDFTHRRAGTGTWCKHIKFVHQVLKEEFSPKEEFPYHLPLWKLDKVLDERELIEFLGGLYEVLNTKPTQMGIYSHDRRSYSKPMIGVEFEVPFNHWLEYQFLLHLISALKEKGIVAAYERDSSVRGGEIKLNPFPATLEECLEKGKLLEHIKELLPHLFVGEEYISAGLHIHINMTPFSHISAQGIKVKLSPIVSLFEKRFDIEKLFGRSFNGFALQMKYARGKDARYGWINYETLPHTIEVRLGCAIKGNPVRILLMGLLFQKLFWARLEGRFSPPPIDASREEIISAFASVLSEEEKAHVVPLLEEALV